MPRSMKLFPRSHQSNLELTRVFEHLFVLLLGFSYWYNMNSIAQHVYGESSHASVVLANKNIMNACRFFWWPVCPSPAALRWGCLCKGRFHKIRQYLELQGTYKDHQSPNPGPNLPGDTVSFSIHSASRSHVGAGSYFLPFELLQTFPLAFQPPCKAAPLQSCWVWDFPPHTPRAFYPTPNARTNMIHVFEYQASRLSMRESQALHGLQATIRSSATVFV